MRWPGAVTVAKGGHYCSIYVGDGIKKGDHSINPVEPPQVFEDPLDLEEVPEPNPKDEPPAVDPDAGDGSQNGDDN